MLDSKQTTVEKAPLMNLSDLSYCPGGVLPYVAYTGMCRWTCVTWTCVFPRESFQARNRQTSLGVAENRFLFPGREPKKAENSFFREFFSLA